MDPELIPHGIASLSRGDPGYAPHDGTPSNHGTREDKKFKRAGPASPLTDLSSDPFSSGEREHHLRRIIFLISL